MAEKYRPLFKLDAGGMAEVYVAEAESMAGFTKKVAIKRILPGLLKDERFVRMFLDEARLSLNLNHANVVSVFDIGKSNDTYFIVMEFVEGTTLKTILEWHTERNRQLPVHITVWMITQILDGLQYAHELENPEKPGTRLGIVHRDISPPNILVSWKGEVKLTDFGLAKATTQLESTDPGVVKGKFAYLSPEAAQGTEVDGRTDIFAVGILAYEMLTGKRLFLGETDWQTVEKVRAAEIPSISGANKDVTAELERVVRKALAKDVEDRYVTAGDFADDMIGVMFSMGKRVSARELSHILEEVREEKSAVPGASQSSPRGIIADLISEEMLNFRSIDAEESGDATPAVSGSAALVDFGDDDDDDLMAPPPDSSYAPPLLPGLPGTPPSGTDTVGPLPDEAGIPAPQDQQESAGLVRSPTPKKERSAGSIVAFLLILLVLGGSAAYYFLVMKQ
jgi:serine/threonine-protein kinase